METITSSCSTIISRHLRFQMSSAWQLKRWENQRREVTDASCHVMLHFPRLDRESEIFYYLYFPHVPHSPDVLKDSLNYSLELSKPPLCMLNLLFTLLSCSDIFSPPFPLSIFVPSLTFLFSLSLSSFFLFHSPFDFNVSCSSADV